MNNSINQNANPGIFRIRTLQEYLLRLFIILSPIYKCFEDFTIMGYNIITIVIIMLLAIYALNTLHILNTKQNGYFSLFILLILLAEIYRRRNGINIGLVLSMFLYGFFLQTDETVRLEKLYSTFSLSAICAALFSVGLGLVDGAVTRVATSVDGSIAVICLSIIFFVDETDKNEDEKRWITAKLIPGLASAVVLIFGMSRARILIALCMFAIYMLRKFWDILKQGTSVSALGVLSLAFVLLIVVVLSLFFDIEQLISPILNRFEDGLESTGRDAELEFAFEMFKYNKIWGYGWRDAFLMNYEGSVVAYSNHNWYIAIIARGGIIMAIPVFLSMLTLLLRSILIRKKHKAALVLMIILLLLSYGNAGVFNYTICSMIPLIVLNLKRSIKNES